MEIKLKRDCGCSWSGGWGEDPDRRGERDGRLRRVSSIVGCPRHGYWETAPDGAEGPGPMAGDPE